jgi:hypothetical protein
LYKDLEIARVIKLASLRWIELMSEWRKTHLAKRKPSRSLKAVGKKEN